MRGAAGLLFTEACGSNAHERDASGAVSVVPAKLSTSNFLNSRMRSGGELSVSWTIPGGSGSR